MRRSYSNSCKGENNSRISECSSNYRRVSKGITDTPTYHIDWHVELRQGQVAIAQHGVIREVHLHAIEQRVYDVIAQQCGKLGTIATLNNVEQCSAAQARDKVYIRLLQLK